MELVPIVEIKEGDRFVIDIAWIGTYIVDVDEIMTYWSHDESRRYKGTVTVIYNDERLASLRESMEVERIKTQQVVNLRNDNTVLRCVRTESV